MSTHVLVLYDIQNDRIRQKTADICMDYGLDRTQFSAFYGRISRPLQRELMQRLANLLGENTGTLLLVPVGDDDWNRRIEIRVSAAEEQHPAPGDKPNKGAVSRERRPDDPF